MLKDSACIDIWSLSRRSYNRETTVSVNVIQYTSVSTTMRDGEQWLLYVGSFTKVTQKYILVLAKKEGDR
jgi:hypothetical protein